MLAATQLRSRIGIIIDIGITSTWLAHTLGSSFSGQPQTKQHRLSESSLQGLGEHCSCSAAHSEATPSTQDPKALTNAAARPFLHLTISLLDTAIENATPRYTISWVLWEFALSGCAGRQYINLQDFGRRLKPNNYNIKKTLYWYKCLQNNLTE